MTDGVEQRSLPLPNPSGRPFGGGLAASGGFHREPCHPEQKQRCFASGERGHLQPVGNPSTNYCWGYDALGNRTIQASSSNAFQTGSPSCTPQSGASLTSTWATFNANNHVTGTTLAPGGLAYDVGNVVNDGVNQYLYDGEGRICAVASGSALIGYIYNAEGQRVSKGTISEWSCDPGVNGFQATNDYILGLAGEQVTEMARTGNTMAWQHTNVYAAGALLATYDKNGLHFYLNDPLGTRRAQTDYAGVLEQTCSNLPFGDSLNCTGSIDNPTEQHFTGKERDTESGLDYFGARYYGSSMGRFMSADDGSDQDPSNPQSWNLYSYVRNNPLSNTDDDGRSVNVCTTGSDGDQQCTLLSNEQYRGATQGEA